MIVKSTWPKHIQNHCFSCEFTFVIVIFRYLSQRCLAFFAVLSVFCRNVVGFFRIPCCLAFLLPSRLAFRLFSRPREHSMSNESDCEKSMSNKSDCFRRPRFKLYVQSAIFFTIFIVVAAIFMLMGAPTARIGSINHPTYLPNPTTPGAGSGSQSGCAAANRHKVLNGLCPKATDSTPCKDVERSLVPNVISSTYLLGNQIYTRTCSRSECIDIRGSDESDHPADPTSCARCAFKNQTAVDRTKTIDGSASCRVSRNDVVLDGVITKAACKPFHFYFFYCRP